MRAFTVVVLTVLTVLFIFVLTIDSLLEVEYVVLSTFFCDVELPHDGYDPWIGK